MKKPERLEDLTKEQLIIYIRRLDMFPHRRQLLLSAVWEETNERAKSMMDAAVQKIRANAPTEGDPERRANWMKAQQDFDEAQCLFDEAGEFFKAFIDTGGEPCT